MVVPAGVMGGTAASSDTEAFCGGYLNQITGQTLPGTVIGMFNTHLLFNQNTILLAIF